MRAETSGWSGDGDFTIRLLQVLEGIDGIAGIRVEDAPSSRSGAGFNLLANEVFLTFATGFGRLPGRWFGRIRGSRRRVARLTLAGLADRLRVIPDVGAPDYADEGMLQYLRTERIVTPHQSRGYKLVEMVRLYSVTP